MNLTLKPRLWNITDQNMVDGYNHLIPKGSKYIKCQNYQKQKESQSGIHYKLLPKSVAICIPHTSSISFSEFG